MFKDMKLSAKIMSGFIAVLILTAIVAVIGWRGLDAVDKIVTSADDANRLIKLAKDCRISDQAYVLADNDTERDKKGELNANALAEIAKQVDDTMTRLSDPADRELLKKTKDESQTYATAFKGWKENRVEQAKSEKAMVDSAKAFEEKCVALRDIQSTKVTMAVGLMHDISTYARAHMHWASIVRDFLINRNEKKLNVQLDGTKCSFGKWLASDEFKTQSALAGKRFQELVAQMVSEHLALHANAAKVEQARSGDADNSVAVFKTEVFPILEQILAKFDELEDLTLAVLKTKQQNVVDANELIAGVKECRRQEKNFFIRHDVASKNALEDKMKNLLDICDALKNRLEVPADKQKVDDVRAQAVAYKQAFDKWATIYDAQTLKLADMEADANQFVADCNSLRNSLKDKMESTVSYSTWMMIGGAGFAIVVGLLMGILITLGITKPINRIIEGLTSSSVQTSAAAGQISSASQQLAEGATEQAASLEETSSALEEMASMTRQNADNAASANNMMIDNRKQVSRGSEAVRNMAGAMGQISESSDQISKIIKTIEEIAFQTNLLALNAAVEAARAGDAGKGFAVVADEVRNLAQRSAQAARDTAELIEGTVDRVKNGTTIVEELEKSFAQVEEGSAKVASLVEEISAASNEQAQGVDQVNTAVAQMDKVTQSNAANAEESASASEELSAQAEQLNQMVQELSSLVGGAAAKQGANASALHAPQPAHTTAPVSHLSHKPLIAHHAIKAPAYKKDAGPKVIKPEEAIPFDDKEF